MVDKDVESKLDKFAEFVKQEMEDMGLIAYINKELGIEAYTFKSPRMTITTGRAGAEMIEKSMKQEFEKQLKTK